MVLARQRLAADLATELRRVIATSEPGSRLPSEKELADEYGTSRNTVREALLSLWDEGLVIRKWGVGTFVRDVAQPAAQSVSPVITAQDLIKTSGRDVTLLSADIERVPCPADAASALSIDEGSPAWKVDRTFAFDGRPAFILVDWFAPVINGRTIDPSPLTRIEVGLLDLLSDSARCRILRMEAEFAAITADLDIADRLRVDVGTPLILAEQVSVDGAGDIRIFSRNYYHTAVSPLHLIRSTRKS